CPLPAHEPSARLRHDARYHSRVRPVSRRAGRARWDLAAATGGRPPTAGRPGLVRQAQHKNDHNRSIALSRLDPVLSVGGVGFVNLQQEYRDSDLAALDRLPIRRFDKLLMDFADTAAVIGELDLVIAVHTAVAHLAGAMAKPVWLLVPQI